MTTKAGFLNAAGRRPSERDLVVWLLWTVAVICGWIWGRGLFLALSVGPEQHVAAPSLASWDDLPTAGAMLRDPFQVLSVFVGVSRAHRLQSWASSSFVFGMIAEAAIFLNLYLRKRGWGRVPKLS